MTSDVAVVISCSEIQGLLPQYVKQLENAGIEVHVTSGVKYEDKCNQIGSLGRKTRNLALVANQMHEYRYLVLSDAFDVLFYGSKQEVVDKLAAVGQHPLLATERFCWPDAYLADFFKGGGTPWRYVNGGLMAGTPEGIGTWAEWMASHPAFIPAMVDQQWLNQRLLQGEDSGHFTMDYRTQLFYCANYDKGELGFEDGRAVNHLLGTMPNFIHFNGGTDSTKYQLLCGLSKLKGATK